MTWASGGSDVPATWATAVNGAVFGSGTAGTYNVGLGGNSYALTNVTFNTAGYTLADGVLAFNAAGNFIVANASATISAAVTNTTVGNIAVANGSMLTLSGGGGFASGNLEVTGNGTVDFNSGTFAGNSGNTGNNVTFWTQTTNVTMEAATLNIARLMVGYGANSTLTINSANAVINNNGGGGNNLIGRSGNTGTMILENGTVNFSHSGNDMRLAYDQNSVGILTVAGGVFNDGANNIYVNYDGYGAPGSGTLNISGGTVIANSIMLGGGANASAYIAGSKAAFNMTGGTLYVGAGGINVNSANTGTLNSSIHISGGIIGATNSAWTSTASMILGTTGGNITFQAADSVGVAHNITLNGALSGTGGLNASGAGIVTLGGVNTYTGNTTVEAGGTLVLANTGHLSFEIGANGINNQVNGTGGLTLNGTLDINLAGADSADGDLWDLIADSNVTYGSGFNLTGFTDNDGIWTDTANGTTYEYNQNTGDLTTISATPEPSMISTAVLSGLGMAFIFRRRR